MTTTGSRTTRILGVLSLVLFAVEVKTPTGEVTVKQQAFGDRVMKAGGLFAVARSVEDFLDVLDTAAELACRVCTDDEWCEVHAPEDEDEYPDHPVSVSTPSTRRANLSLVPDPENEDEDEDEG